MKISKNIAINHSKIGSSVAKHQERFPIQNHLTRQYKRKLNRELCNNKWFVPNWQPMKFIHTIDDYMCSGQTMDVYANDIYQCLVRKYQGIIHISLKRNDKAPIHNWQHMQQIKNDVVGEESEAVELYPAMSRIADAANQYHLWVLPDKQKFDIGFNSRLVNL